MVLILCGKSGAGKDSVLKKLVENDGFTPIISDATRPMRDNEIDGVDYNFISQERFLEKLGNGGYIEHREYHTILNGMPTVWYYGCPADDYKDAEKDFVVIFDINGAKEFASAIGRENCVVCEILVKDEIREERAKARGGFDKAEWDTRLKDDNIRFAPSETHAIADFGIDNTDRALDETAKAVADNYRNAATMRRGMPANNKKREG